MKMNKMESFLIFFLSINFVVSSDNHLFMDQTSHKTSRNQLKKQYERCKKKLHADVPSGKNIENFDVSGLRRRNRFSSIDSVDDQSKSMTKVVKWPRGEVPVEMEPGLTRAEKSSLKCAILYFRAHTCLTFLHKNETHEDYLYLMKTDKNGGCVTDTIGKNGGKQILNLDSANDHCWEHGTIIHELMHVLGFFHEQSRLDRDQHIVVHWNNIPKSLYFQYWTTAEMGYTHNDIGKYDYGSVMHYNRYLGFNLAISAKVKNDQYEEQAKNNDAMGQRIEPSDEDTNKLNLMYCPNLITQLDPGCKDELDCTDFATGCQISEFVRNKCKNTCGLCEKSIREHSVALTTRSTTVTHSSTKSYCEDQMDCTGLNSLCPTSEVIRNKCKRTCGLCDQSVKNVCVLDNPCENNGTCTDGENGMTYVCKCTTGWSGINCTIDVSIKVLLIGGTHSVSSMEYYYPHQAQYNALINVTMIEPRGYHASIVMNDGKILTMGAWSNNYPVNNVEIFDPVTTKLTKGPNMNTARSGCDSAMVNGIVYVCGGYDGRNRLSTCERYQSGVWEYIPSMHKARNNLVLISLNGHLYAIGGSSNRRTESNSVEKYNPNWNSNSWMMVKSMQAPRRGHGAAVLNGLIYVCGGDKRHSCERYDPTLNKWSYITKTIINRGDGMRMVSVGQHLFAFGGYYSKADRSVEMYDPKKGKWFMFKKPLIHKRQYHSAVVLH